MKREAMAPGWRDWLVLCATAPCAESYDVYTECAWTLESAAAEVDDYDDARRLAEAMISHPHYQVRKRSVMLAMRFGLEFPVEWRRMRTLAVESGEFTVLGEALERVGVRPVWGTGVAAPRDSEAGVLGEPLESIMAEIGVPDVIAMGREVGRSSLGLLDLCKLGSASADRYHLVDQIVDVCLRYTGEIPHEVGVALLLALGRDYKRADVPFAGLRAIGEVPMMSSEDWSGLWGRDPGDPVVDLSDPRLLPVLNAHYAQSRLRESVVWPSWAPVVRVR